MEAEYSTEVSEQTRYTTQGKKKPDHHLSITHCDKLKLISVSKLAFFHTAVFENT